MKHWLVIVIERLYYLAYEGSPEWIEAKGSLIKLWLYLSNRRSHLASGICAYPAGDYEADPEQV